MSGSSEQPGQQMTAAQANALLQAKTKQVIQLTDQIAFADANLTLATNRIQELEAELQAAKNAAPAQVQPAAAE